MLKEHKHVDPATPSFLGGALRSRLVAKLAGLTLRQLSYWHSTGLIDARVDRGGRGHPRLYSWSDYIKVREAAKLRAAGILAPTVRRAVEYLESRVPDWYLVPLRTEGEQVITRIQQAGPDPDPGTQVPLVKTLRELHKEGPLGALQAFSDSVEMNPHIRGGTPVVAKTRIETAFVASLHQLGRPDQEISDLYKIPLHRVRRAIEFEEAVA